MFGGSRKKLFISRFLFLFENNRNKNGSFSWLMRPLLLLTVLNFAMKMLAESFQFVKLYSVCVFFLSETSYSNLFW